MRDCTFKATGSHMIFKGYTASFSAEDDDNKDSISLPLGRRGMPASP